MLEAHRIRTASGLILSLGLLAGCFTEVGNAEDDRVVQAKFQIEYQAPPALPKAPAIAPESTRVDIMRFYLGVREAEFHLFDSLTNRKEEYHLWSDDSATLDVDFTGNDSLAKLPNQKVGILNPLDMDLNCAFPPHHVLNPDTVDFPAFGNRSYIKGLLLAGSDTTRFLFALPNTGAFHLEYQKPILNQWYMGGVYRCEFIFYANRWVAAVDFSKALPSRDKSGMKMLILDPEHNGSLHDTLEARFYQAFNASKASFTADP